MIGRETRLRVVMLVPVTGMCQMLLVVSFVVYPVVLVNAGRKKELDSYSTPDPNSRPS